MTQGIGIAGTGRMAKALGKVLASRDVEISAVGGRSAASTTAAAGFIGCSTAVSIRELPRYSNRILVSVSDDAIGSVADELAAGGLRGGLVLHTCGAAGPEVLGALRARGNAVGVLHPLQGVPVAQRGVEALPGATFACAGDAAAEEWGLSLVEALHGRRLAVDPKRWDLYHAAAAIAGNYHCTLVDAALELLEQAGVAREEALPALASFLRATTESILALGPVAALPGPISRGDSGTIRKHLAALGASGSPAVIDLYVASARRTIEVARRKGLAERPAQEIEEVLNNFTGRKT